MRWLRLGAVALLPAVSQAGTIGVVVHSDVSPIEQRTIEAVTWHALWSASGHEAVFFDALDASVVDTLIAEKITTLVEIRVEWIVDATSDAEHGALTGARAPIIHLTEHAIDKRALWARSKWTTSGAIALYALDEPSQDLPTYISMPEVALQDAMSLAVQPVTAPVWTITADELVHIPLVITADDEYRSFYGPSWKTHIERRVARANGLLRRAGLALSIEATQEWDSPDHLTDLSALLDDLALLERPIERGIRVGLTQQTDLATRWNRTSEDVGRAFVPGRDMVIADQALAPGHDPVWDEVEEATALAHEALHSLGVPHLEADGFLMSARKTGTVHTLHPSTIALASSAAEARFRHWDALVAAVDLGDAARDHIGGDPGLQRDYITTNLEYGPGVPGAPERSARRLSAMVNVAIAAFYLKRAEQEPNRAGELGRNAEAYAREALVSQPTFPEATALLERARRILAPPAPLPEPSEPETPCGSLTPSGRRITCE